MNCPVGLPRPIRHVEKVSDPRPAIFVSLSEFIFAPLILLPACLADKPSHFGRMRGCNPFGMSDLYESERSAVTRERSIRALKSTNNLIRVMNRRSSLFPLSSHLSYPPSSTGISLFAGHLPVTRQYGTLKEHEKSR